MTGQWHNIDLAWIILLPMMVGCISWTWCKEMIFSEIQAWLSKHREHAPCWWQRKIATGLTCEYCFSHWVTLICLFIVDWRLLLPDWRGCVMAFFLVVCLANVYMSLYNLLRIDLRINKTLATKEEATT